LKFFMRYILVVCALMTSLATQNVAAASSAPSVHMLCQSRGGHFHVDCLLVNSQGVRLTRELFNTHEDMPTDGMLRTLTNVAKASGGYDWRYGFINTQGQVVVPPIYKKANAFSSGLALVTTDQGRAYIDTSGRVALVVAAQWYDALDFHHGLALVRGEGYMTGTHPMSSVGPRRVAPPWSVIDKTGRVVLEPSKKHWREDSLRKLYPPEKLGQKPSAALAKKFYRIEDFHEGLAWASQCKTDTQGSHTCQSVGFVNTQGQWVFKVDSGAYIERPFHQGHAVLLVGNAYPTNYGQTEVLVDRTGRVVANYAELVTLRKPK
jgi:WG containing repeat